MELHNWMQLFMINKETDKQELILYMTDLKNGQDKLNTAMQAQGQDLQFMMLMMQNVRSIPDSLNHVSHTFSIAYVEIWARR